MSVVLPFVREDHRLFVYYPIEIISVRVKLKTPVKEKEKIFIYLKRLMKINYRMMNMNFGYFIENIIDKII